MNDELSPVAFFRFVMPPASKPEELFLLRSQVDAGRYRFSSNTFFNRFPSHHIQDLTGIESCGFHFKKKAAFEGKITLWAQSMTDEYPIWQARVSSDRDEYDFWFETQGLLNVWFELDCPDSIDLESFSTWFSYDKEMPKKEIFSFQVGICTISEAEWVSKNVLKLLEYDFPAPLRLESVVVVDQGNQSFDFPKIEKVKLLRQANLGGSGGFARAIDEMLLSNPDGYFLMDGDIEFEPEILERILQIAAVSNNKIALGTQMLNLRIPTENFSDNETIQLSALWPGPNPTGRTKFHANELPVITSTPTMLPWWCAYFPSQVGRDVGLPSPFFIHWDDTDYSLRLQKSKVRIAVLPGSAVWHEPFDAKPANGWIAYFDLRNALIGGASNDAKLRDVMKFSCKFLGYAVLSHRYDKANIALLAIKHFRLGPDRALLAGNQRERVLRHQADWSKKHSVSQADSLQEHLVRNPKAPSKRKVLLLIANSFLGRRKQVEVALMSSENSAITSIFSNSNVLLYGRYGGKPEILTFNLELFRKLTLRAIVETFRLALTYNLTSKRWKRDLVLLRSPEEWRRRWFAD